MNHVPDPELRRLTDRLLDTGKPDAADIARLTELLESPEAMDWFLTVVQQEELLREIVPHHVAALRETRPVRFPAARVWRRACAAAALLAVGAGLGLLASRERDSATETAPGGNARLTALVGARWKTRTSPDPLAGAASPSRLALEAGLAELTYDNGVRVTIEGPCDYSVSGSNAGRLVFGKLVARVPRGAEGFRVDYARGHIVDLGTEFAMEVSDDGAAEVGVFEGRIELHRPGADPVPLFANQAVVTSADGNPPEAVPLDREKFIRQVPSRDFRWSCVPGKPSTFRADVSHLVWKASQYRMLFKAVGGPKDASTEVKDVKLLRDGRIVALDKHKAVIGTGMRRTRDCLYAADVPESDFETGRWTVEATLTADAATLGVLQFEEGLVSHAVEADFLGAWDYTHIGHRYRREILPGGKVNLLRDGVPDRGGFRGAHWFVRDGVLHIEADNIPAPELHFLRDRDTLIFANLPYENAKRAAPAEKK